MPGRYAALVLSRGEQFQQHLTPRQHGFTSWPLDSTVHTTFYDTAGGVLADIAGIVTPTDIVFDVAPDEVDVVAAGAPYETFLTTGDGKPFQIRYGNVIRKEAQFFNAAARVTSNFALQFRDNFYNRLGRVGSKWIVLDGKPIIYDHSGSLPNAVGPNNSLFYKCAMRYYAPLNSDSFILSFTLLNPGPGVIHIAGSCDATMMSNRAVSIVTDPVVSGNRKIHMGKGTGRYTFTDQVTPVSHTLVNLENFKLRYDDMTKEMSLWNSDMTTELISWTDDTDIVPVGAGFRHFAISWEASLTSTGPQLTEISAQDGLTLA